MFGKLRSSLRKSFRWKPGRDRHANRSGGGDGGDAILGSGSADASSAPRTSSSPAHHADATPSNSGSNTAAAATTSSDNAANSKVPRQWQLDESAVRAGTCAFAVKYLGCAEVFESRGMHVCEQALVLLRDNMVHRKPQRAILYVSGEGLRVVDSKSRNLLVDQTIEKVSFCSPDRNHSKGFAYICRDGTTRRWICHGFNAVADTGERLSHAVGCAFQECLQRKQTREKQLRTKQQTSSNSDTGSNNAVVSNSHPSNSVAGSSATITSSPNRLGTSNATETLKSALVTGNQMNANFQRGTHRTQSLADRRLDPQAFVKVDKPPLPAAENVSSPYNNGNTPVMVDAVQPQEFRRAQSSRVFSTQFVRQRIRSSIRGGDAPAATQSGVAGAGNMMPPNSTVNTSLSRSFQQHASLPSNQHQEAHVGGVQAGFYNPGINFASPTSPETSPLRHFKTTSPPPPPPVVTANNDTISFPTSWSSNLQSSSSSSIRNEIMDLCARITKQDFSASSGRDLSSTTTPVTAADAELRMPRPYTASSVLPPPPTHAGNNDAWNYVARPSSSSAAAVAAAPAVRTVPIPPRSNVMPSNSAAAGAGNVENTQYYHVNGRSAVNGSSTETKQQHRPNHLPAALLSKRSSTVVEEDEDPFSPPGWVDKTSNRFGSFSPSSAASAFTTTTTTKPQSPEPTNDHTFQKYEHRPKSGAVPFNQLRDEENGVGGGTPRRNPTPAEPTAAVNGSSTTAEQQHISGDYVPAEYFSRGQQQQYRYRPQPVANNVQEADPFNTTWVKLDTE